MAPLTSCRAEEELVLVEDLLHDLGRIVRQRLEFG
jgi:hypothetical protein